MQEVEERSKASGVSYAPGLLSCIENFQLIVMIFFIQFKLFINYCASTIYVPALVCCNESNSFEEICPAPANEVLKNQENPDNGIGVSFKFLPRHRPARSFTFFVDMGRKFGKCG
jgi:hypothetical protein